MAEGWRGRTAPAALRESRRGPPAGTAPSREPGVPQAQPPVEGPLLPCGRFSLKGVRVSGPHDCLPGSVQ